MAKLVTDPALLAALEGGGSPVTDPAVLAQLDAKPEQVGTGLDVARSGIVGAGKGLIGIAGFPADAFELGSRAGAWVNRKLGGSSTREDQVPAYGSGAIQKKVEEYTGEFYKPQTTYGKYAQTVGEFAPGAVAGPGGFLRKAITQALLPGLASEAAGQATEGKPAEPYARAAGALAGAVAPNAIGRLITPAPSSAARQGLVQTLENEGVTSLTAGQRTGNEPLRYAESVLGNAPGAGQRTNRITREGQEQFTAAAMRRAGAGPDAAPEVLAQNQDRLGQQFRDLSARNTLQMDQQFARDVGQAVRHYERVPPSQQKAVVEQYVNDIIDHANRAGAMPGQEYQAMRSMLSTQSKGVRNTDHYLSNALRDLRNALDNAMGRSISPADRELWNSTRREYGAQKVLEKTASKAGEVTAEGQITPANLRNTVASRDNGAYARGQGDFAGLARAGAGVMGSMPQSGTGPRMAMMNLATMAGPAALGGGAGYSADGWKGAAEGAALGMVGPAALGRLLMSRPVQAALSNQIATPMLRNLTPRQAAIVSALLAANQQRALAPPP